MPVIGLAALNASVTLTSGSTPQTGVINTYNASSAPIAVTLPLLSLCNIGANFMICKDTLDTPTNAVTFTRAGSDTFDDGTTTVVLSQPGEARTLQVVSYDGIAKFWKIMATSVNSSAAAPGSNTLAGSFDPHALSGNTALLTNTNFTASEYLEIGAGYSLEIPATSSLEIYTYVVDTSKLALGGAQNATVATTETTASTTYTDLATTTDVVTATIGLSGMALVSVYGLVTNNTLGNFSDIAFDASGANTLAANAARALAIHSATNNSGASASASFLLTGLSAGATTFKLKYKVTGGTGSFSNRRIAVIPL